MIWAASTGADFLIDDTHADDLASTRLRQLEKQGADWRRGQKRHQRTVVARESDPLVLRPGATARVHGEALARQTDHDASQEILRGSS